MKCFLVLALSLASLGAYAADEPASETSIRQLFEVMQTQKLLDSTMAQMDTMMQNSMKQAVGAKTLTPDEQAVMDDMRTKVVALIRDDMSWEILEPEFLDIYRSSFTEEEVVGMLDFYRSEPGQALITKMPIVMQRSMEMTQRRMATILPKLQQVEKEALEQLKACCKDGAK